MKNTDLITRCKSLPTGETVYGCPDDPNEVHGTLLTTDHIIHLATELEKCQEKLAHYADKGNWKLSFADDFYCEYDDRRQSSANGYDEAQSFFEEN